MQCPAGCDASLVMSERQNVEIDYCPTCRGVWLDRGELDKILERATQQLNEAPAAAPQPPPPAYEQSQGYQQPQAQRMPMGTRGSPAPGYSHGGQPKKKKSFLSEMFEF